MDSNWYLYIKLIYLNLLIILLIKKLLLFPIGKGHLFLIMQEEDLALSIIKEDGQKKKKQN